MPVKEGSNRSSRRKHAKFLRSPKWLRKSRIPYVEADAHHWHRKIAVMMKDSPRVMRLLASGKLDRILKVGG